MNKMGIKTELNENKLPEGWKKVRLEEVCKKITDGTHKTPQYTEEGIPFISTNNLVPFRKYFNFSSYRKYISGKEHSILIKRCKPEKDDLLVSKCGTIGRTQKVIVNYEFSIFVGLALIKLENTVLSDFLEQLLNSFEYQTIMLNSAPGGTRATLTINGIKDIEVSLPPLSEQCRIAEILETVDETIEKTDAIIEKYKRVKQGLMQNLLTKGITVFEFEKDKLIDAVKRVFDSGDHSFGREENLVSHLSRHLNEFFPGWNVDSEVEKNSDRQRPDIIIHKRRTDENLFVIEVKKNENLNAIKKDIEKLEDVMLGDYHYEDVVFIGFDIDNFEDVFKLSEKVNFILVSKNGEIKVKSRVRRFKKSPLGRIPEEWEVVELRENISVLLSNVDKKIFNFEQKILLCNYLDVYKNEYINNSISFMRGSANRREIKKFGVSKGNVIITKDSEEFNDIAKSAYVRDEINNLICGYHLALLKPSKRIDGLYLSKILKLYKVNSFFQRRANGITRFGISKETIEKALISLPTLPEQKRIASVLSQIDETIEKEQKYKQKLEQIKQGLMENLLTGKVRVNHLIKEGVESV